MSAQKNILNQISEVLTQEMLIQIQPSLAMFTTTGLMLELVMFTPTSPKNNSTKWVSNSSKPKNILNQTSEVPTQETLIQIQPSLPTFTTTGLILVSMNTHNQISEVPTQEMHTLTLPSQATSVTIGLP